MANKVPLSNYNFLAYAGKVEIFPMKNGMLVSLEEIEEGAFDNYDTISRMDLDRIIKTIGADVILDRIGAMKVEKFLKKAGHGIKHSL